MMNNFKCIALLVLFTSACGRPPEESSATEKMSGGPFKNDIDFLGKYMDVIVLTDPSGKGKVAVSAALQGRVMTSSANGMEGESYGWINKSLFESGDTSVHMNAFGGEERFWLGPEGGQFSLFFKKGEEFNLENWATPGLIDLDPFELVSKTQDNAIFSKSAVLKNYAGTEFKIKITREVNVLDPAVAYLSLGVDSDPDTKVIAYQTRNSVENTGSDAWTKKSGVLSIWLLGMLNPTPETVMVVPFNKGDEQTLGPIVNDAYFGKVPSDRLKVGDGVIYFKGDGNYRSKIGLSPLRAKNVLGSYDYKTNTLTIVKYEKPEGVTDYVNSAWEIQDQPFKGDVVNAYNDGPPSPGAKPLGPFNELESSSPALELKPGERVVHNQTTFHFQGKEEEMNKLMTAILGVSVNEVKNAFQAASK